jgi:hypothetical protein
MFLKEAANMEEREVGGELDDPDGEADDPLEVDVTTLGRLEVVMTGKVDREGKLEVEEAKAAAAAAARDTDGEDN